MVKHDLSIFFFFFCHQVPCIIWSHDHDFLLAWPFIGQQFVSCVRTWHGHKCCAFSGHLTLQITVLESAFVLFFALKSLLDHIYILVVWYKYASVAITYVVSKVGLQMTLLDWLSKLFLFSQEKKFQFPIILLIMTCVIHLIIILNNISLSRFNQID